MPKETLGPDLKEVTEMVMAGVADLARSILGGALIEAKYDVKNFLEAVKGDLARWIDEVASGKISPEDFTWFVKGKKDLAEMKLLIEAGMPAVRIDRFRESLVDLICKTVLSRVGIV